MRSGRVLRRDGYAQLLLIPFAEHDRAFAAENLEAVVHEELATLAAAASGEPVVYTYTLCREHYARRLSVRTRLLGDLFLYNRRVAHDQVRADAPEYLRFLLADGDGCVSSALRIVPVYELLLVADPLNANDDARVFLHNDSVQMARHLRRERPCVARVVADVGTGSGLLAAVAATQAATHVIAVDINPRARICTCVFRDQRPGSGARQ